MKAIQWLSFWWKYCLLYKQTPRTKIKTQSIWKTILNLIHKWNKHEIRFLFSRLILVKSMTLLSYCKPCSFTPLLVQNSLDCGCGLKLVSENIFTTFSLVFRPIWKLFLKPNHHLSNLELNCSLRWNDLEVDPGSIVECFVLKSII